MYKNIIFLFFSFVTYNTFGHTTIDSLGIQKRDGKTYIMHKVEPKETFFSISQRYKITIDDLVNQNPETKDGLKMDQIILIPYGETPKSRDLKRGEVLHVVKPSETLFSIAKLYDVNLNDIKQWNVLSGNNLSVSQELLIKRAKKNQSGTTTLSEAPVVPMETNSGANVNSVVTHTVEQSQTLFSIAKMYDVKVEDLRTWNNMNNNDLTPGQKLVVKRKVISDMTAEIKEEKKNTFLSEEKQVVKENFEPYEESPQKTSVSDTNHSITVTPAVAETTVNSGMSKRVELGLAEVIEGTGDSKKYRALHRTAPVGTIIQVKNEMNNQSVFVRVLGKLPDTGENNKVLIKISKSAYESLGAINNRFPVEISYIP